MAMGLFCSLILGLIGESGDNSVIELALQTGGYVLTNDKELRRRLRKEGVPIILLRSGTHLVIDTYRGD